MSTTFKIVWVVVAGVLMAADNHGLIKMSPADLAGMATIFAFASELIAMFWRRISTR